MTKGDWYKDLVEKLGEGGAKAEMRRRRSLRKSTNYTYSTLDRETLQEYGRIGGSKSKKGKHDETQESGQSS